MGLSEMVQGRRGLVTAAALFMIAMGSLMIVYQLFGNKRTSVPAQAWFTTDDGATLFKDDISRVPPFEHGGHEAVAAYPYTADGGKHQWVQFLAKYDSKTAAPPPGPALLGRPPSAPAPMPLVKKPGAVNWVPYSDPRARYITRPQAPAGMGTEKPEKVYP